MIIGFDFDGTCYAYAWPQIGPDIGGIAVLKELAAQGHQLVLSTMRSNHGGKDYLTQAVRTLEYEGIELWGINSTPTQHKWSSSPKPFCNLYIGVDALGCPVKEDPGISNKPFVDWKAVRKLLTEKKILV